MTRPDERVARILDANLNRAREGLRVIEEHARFIHDDAAAAGALKALRHGLQALASRLGQARLLAARAVESDVGLALRTEAEHVRSAPEDVAAAAFARCGEALRVIAEYGKLLDPEAAQVADRLRYELYALQPRVLLRAERVAALRRAKVYALLTDSLCRHGWEKTLAELLAAGVRCVQLREKQLADGEFLRRALRAREMTHAAGALLCINDRAEIARLSAADVLHLGQGDLPLRAARRLVGGEMLIGLSTHTPAELDAALRQSPDYVAVGPMYASHTKQVRAVAGPAFLRQARERTELPIVAIGGVDAARAPEVLAGGADVVAVCAALIAVESPGDAARALLAATGR